METGKIKKHYVNLPVKYTGIFICQVGVDQGKFFFAQLIFLFWAQLWGTLGYLFLGRTEINFHIRGSARLDFKD